MELQIPQQLKAHVTCQSATANFKKQLSNWKTENLPGKSKYMQNF